MTKKKTQKNIRYPKCDGEKFDILRRKRFDKFRESFEWTITEVLADVDKKKVLSDKQLKEIIYTTAWNCAYMTVTEL
jgi:hypothetical protein